MYEQLKKYWSILMNDLSVERLVSDQLFQDIIIHYNHPSRHYHNSKHLLNMLDYNRQFSKSTTIQLAIWYHDIIYHVDRSDNELQSATYFEQAFGQLGLSNSLILEIKRLIMLTQNHCASEHDLNGQTIIDLDLAILGSSAPIYQKYLSDIRMEYAQYPDELYIPARIKVVESFLGKSQIFKTSRLKNLESISRYNLQNELKTYHS